MRFLFICNEYPPFLHGGIGTFTRDIAEGLVNLGHEVTVWGLYEGLSIKVEETIKGVHVIRLPYTSGKCRFQKLHLVLNLNRMLGSFLKFNRFDVIECQEWQGLLPFGLKENYIIRLHGAAVFFDKLLDRPGNRLIHFLERLTIKNAKNLVAVSEYCGRETLRLLKLNKPFKVIYNSVDANRIASFRSNTIRKYSIVFANSVLPKKGILELSLAFNKIATVFPEATLTIIGKLGYYKDGKNIKDIILDNIEFGNRSKVSILGWLDKADDVYTFLSQAHICCYPSHMEGFGIAPVEAMVLEKPVVYMKEGPGPEVIINGESGFLVDTKDPEAIANKIIEIFSGQFDLEAIGKNAKARAYELFDRDSVFIKKNIDYYSKVLPE